MLICCVMFSSFFFFCCFYFKFCFVYFISLARCQCVIFANFNYFIKFDSMCVCNVYGHVCAYRASKEILQTRWKKTNIHAFIILLNVVLN